MQLPTSHVVPYATLEETAMQTSLMTAFESSSRFCVSCCNFISVQVMNLFSPVGTLNCDFSIDSLQISSGVPLEHIYHHFIHPLPSIRLQCYNEHSQNVIRNLFPQLIYFDDSGLVLDLLLPFVAHDLQTAFFCKEYHVQMNTIKR